MNYLKMTYPDVNNGTGCRVSLWLTGCSIKCDGCFNEEIWNPKTGITFSDGSKHILFEVLSYPYIDGLSILGGEPTEHDEELSGLLMEVKRKFPTKDIWMWSGYTLKELINKGRTKSFPYIDYLVDGPFIESEKDLTLKFRGSKNQHIYKRQENCWVIYE